MIGSTGMVASAGGAALFLILVLVGVFWVAPIFAANAIGKGKGRSQTWLWGFFLGWIGVIVVACMGRNPQSVIVIPQAQPIASAGSTPTQTAAVRVATSASIGRTRTCPECAETVSAQSSFCEFCGAKLA